jgi:hypothetical protein
MGGRVTVLKARDSNLWHWLITKHVTSQMEVFTTHLCGDEGALAVFSFQEEAEMFLHLQFSASEDGWRVRQTSVGELTSVLYGACSGTKKVVLDPLPELGKEGLSQPLGLHRNEFLQFLLGEEMPSNLHLAASQTYRPQKLVEHGHVA